MGGVACKMCKLWVVVEEGGGDGCPMETGNQKAGGIPDFSHVLLYLCLRSNHR